uniref:Uncharacterized protein n=1 Tax=Physcomitrium patens TaxID=3218 RepID=A0A2K1JYQ4_PHYPA|nr:hypothetical protein PHYPA_013770 [Physcomitrium patens]
MPHYRSLWTLTKCATRSTKLKKECSNFRQIGTEKGVDSKGLTDACTALEQENSRLEEEIHSPGDQDLASELTRCNADPKVVHRLPGLAL